MAQQFKYLDRASLKVDEQLVDFVEQDVLPSTDVTSDLFWDGLATLANDFGPRNSALLQVRADLQSQLDIWHRSHRDDPHKVSSYKRFLKEIGYLVPEGDDFSIKTDNVDVEIGSIAGPQLVVPSTNARFVLNAANARWGIRANSAPVRCLARAQFRTRTSARSGHPVWPSGAGLSFSTKGPPRPHI